MAKNGKQEELDHVFDLLVDLVYKMADKNCAEYNPMAIPALVEKIIALRNLL